MTPRPIAWWTKRMRTKTIKPFGRGFSDAPLRISLCDRNPAVAIALAESFRDVGAVEVLEGDMLALGCDAVVSPANSFGYMDGGVDQAIDRFYEGRAQEAVLALIAERFYGELPVGSAAVLRMETARFGHLVVAPTMRVPGDHLAETINAYLAMRAAFVAILEHNRSATDPIRSVAVPGLGTGVGAMTAEESALQMRAAYDMIVVGGWRSLVHPAQAPFAMRRGGKRL